MVTVRRIDCDLDCHYKQTKKIGLLNKTKNRSISFYSKLCFLILADHIKFEKAFFIFSFD